MEKKYRRKQIVQFNKVNSVEGRREVSKQLEELKVEDDR